MVKFHQIPTNGVEGVAFTIFYGKGLRKHIYYVARQSQIVTQAVPVFPCARPGSSWRTPASRGHQSPAGRPDCSRSTAGPCCATQTAETPAASHVDSMPSAAEIILWGCKRL